MITTSSFSIEKVRKRSTEAKAADTLREAIVQGAIPLGARVTEIMMSEQLGVSRGTIRTAFNQLVQEGLLVQIPYSGWTVMTLSSRDAWEIYTLRASLEALASRLAAERIRGDTDGDASKTLMEAFGRLREACMGGTQSVVADADVDLHRTIVSLAGHNRLNDQYKHIEHQVRVYIRSSDGLIQDPHEIVSQHQPIVDALLTGNPVAAATAAVAHNEREGTRLVEHLRCQEM